MIGWERLTRPEKWPTKWPTKCSERDDVPGASGHRSSKNGFEEEDNVGEELVSGGIEEAAHDQMVEARREELDQEREQR